MTRMATSKLHRRDDLVAAACDYGHVKGGEGSGSRSHITKKPERRVQRTTLTTFSFFFQSTD